jgi:hypothetical protein
MATLTWNRAHSCYGFGNINILTVARWDGALWTNAGVTAATDAGMTGTVTSAVVSSFSPFAVASTLAPLPIELVNFTATWMNNEVVLDWVTASEVNNDYFTLERAEPEAVFQAIATIQGLGTNKDGKSYRYIDEAPLTGQSYYRLKQTDFDGTFTYSKVVTVFNPFIETKFEVYPNPAAVGAPLIFTKVATIEVFNSLNQPVLKSQTTNRLENINLSAGVYFVRTQDGSVVKLIVQ